MIKFRDYLKSKVIHEPASQKYKIMMKRPVTFFDGYEKIKLQKPTKLSSSATKMELFEVQDAMIMSNQRLQYEKKLDVDFLDMMSELVGGGEAELISELKRQIDTITLNLKYSFNRLRPRETAKFYGKNLVPHVAVDTPSYPSNHTAVGYVVAGVLAKKYPEHERELLRIAEDNANSRVSLGVHFVSDVDAGKELADRLLDKYNNITESSDTFKFVAPRRETNEKF